jgi:hypothetical protein
MGVMEMTFPHQALHRDSVKRRFAYRSVLAVASARQAESRTVAILRRSEHSSATIGDEATLRIRYFGGQDERRMAVCGPFWPNVAPERITEASVYQADSAIIKDVALIRQGTGEQFNHAGHGTLRTI